MIGGQVNWAWKIKELQTTLNQTMQVILGITEQIANDTKAHASFSASKSSAPHPRQKWRCQILFGLAYGQESWFCYKPELPGGYPRSARDPLLPRKWFQSLSSSPSLRHPLSASRDSSCVVLETSLRAVTSLIADCIVLWIPLQLVDTRWTAEWRSGLVEKISCSEIPVSFRIASAGKRIWNRVTVVLSHGGKTLSRFDILYNQVRLMIVTCKNHTLIFTIE